MNVKKIFEVLFIVFAILLINISVVNAETSPITCDYGIICNYSLPNIADKAGGYYIGGSSLVVYYQCSNKSNSLDECSSFVSAGYASTSSLDIGAIVNSGTNVADELSFQNYNDIFHNTDSFKDQFKSNDKFICPTLYYKGDKIKGVELFYSSNLPVIGSHSLEKAVLKENECVSQNQTVDWNKVTEDAEEGALGAEEDRYNNEIDDDIRDDIFVDVSKIKDWAQNHGYGDDIDSIGDPCSVINGELKNILSSGMWLISISAIIILVVMTALGFIKAIVGSDDEKLKDAFKNLVTRIIVVIILLLLPMILTFIIELINNSSQGEVKIGSDGNLYCDISKGGSDLSDSKSETDVDSDDTTNDSDSSNNNE